MTRAAADGQRRRQGQQQEWHQQGSSRDNSGSGTSKGAAETTAGVAPAREQQRQQREWHQQGVAAAAVHGPGNRGRQQPEGQKGRQHWAGSSSGGRNRRNICKSFFSKIRSTSGQLTHQYVYSCKRGFCCCCSAINGMHSKIATNTSKSIQYKQLHPFQTFAQVAKTSACHIFSLPARCSLPTPQIANNAACQLRSLPNPQLVNSAAC